MPNKLKRHKIFESDSDWAHAKLHFMITILEEMFDEDMKKILGDASFYHSMEELDKIVNESMIKFYDTYQTVCDYYTQFIDNEECGSE